MSQAWPKPVLLRELGHGVMTLALEPDSDERAAIAKSLDLESLVSLKARVTLEPWMDGVEIRGRFDAVVEQICAVSLDPFEQSLSGEIKLRAVPAGSDHAPQPEGGEAAYDLDAPDPPDILTGEAVDVTAYVIEHLALEIDPFARKPGVEFDYTPADEEQSPFAVLKKLQDPKP